MKYIKALVICIIILISSCEKTLDINLDYENPKLVLIGYFNPDEPFAIDLSESKLIIEEIKKDIVADALVEVYSNNKFIEKLIYDKNSGRYIGSQYPVTYQLYTVKISHPNYKNIKASCFIPKPVSFIIVDSKSHENTTIEEVRIRIKDPANERNYYRLIVEEEWNDYISKTKKYLYPVLISSDNIIKGKGDLDADNYMHANARNIYNIFTDGMINGKEYEFTFSFHHQPYKNMDVNVYISLVSINKDYFDFLNSHEAQINSGLIPFSEPVKLFTNVEGGIGVLGGYSTTQLELVSNKRN